MPTINRAGENVALDESRHVEFSILRLVQPKQKFNSVALEKIVLLLIKLLATFYSYCGTGVEPHIYRTLSIDDDNRHHIHHHHCVDHLTRRNLSRENAASENTTYRMTFIERIEDIEQNLQMTKLTMSDRLWRRVSQHCCCFPKSWINHWNMLWLSAWGADRWWNEPYMTSKCTFKNTDFRPKRLFVRRHCVGWFIPCTKAHCWTYTVHMMPRNNHDTPITLWISLLLCNGCYFWCFFNPDKTIPYFIHRDILLSSNMPIDF